MKPDAELEKCYGVDCLNCAAADCELRECGINRIREKQQETALKFSRADEMVAGAEFCDNINTADGGDLLADHIDHPEPSTAELMRQVQLDTLRRIAFLWAEQPKNFDVLMRKIMLNQNQSDLARAKGVTRQSISKALRQEKNEPLKKKIAHLERLNKLFAGFSQIERDVYRLCFEDGVSVRSAAAQLNISPAKVQRVKQFLRVKLNKSETISRNKKQKKGKF